MIEFCSDIAKLNEKLFVFSKVMFELFENCVVSESITTSIPRRNAEMSQKIVLMDERMTETNDRMIKIEQERNDPTPTPLFLRQVVRAS